jgi:rod shape-determining protein MreC
VAYSSSSNLRASNLRSGIPRDGGGALRLLAYVALAIALMVSDHRGGLFARLHQSVAGAAAPAWWLASLPGRLVGSGKTLLTDQAQLRHDNASLHRQLLIAQARIQGLQALADENDRLRGLLGGTRGDRLAVQMADVLEIDLDPERQRIVLDVGANQGVHVGQAVIDTGGVMGQVIEVTSGQATVLLVSDPDHAVPVQAVRSGLRLIAYGTGRGDRLTVPNIPQSGDLKVGDELVTSGIGGRFPAGFPVGRVTALQPDPNHSFVAATLTPAARLDRSGSVLLVWNLPDDGVPVGPSESGEAATRRAQASLELRNAATSTNTSVPASSNPAASKPAPVKPAPAEPSR